MPKAGERVTTKAKQPVIPITEIEHSAFCRTEDELPAKSLAEEIKVNIRWQKIPTEYLHLSPEELDRRIGEVRAQLGERVTILGHHYQREEVIKYADFREIPSSSPRTRPPSPKPTLLSSAASTSWPRPPASSPQTIRRLSCPTSLRDAPWPTWLPWTTFWTPGTTFRK